MAKLCENADIAQPVERILGKDEVPGSNPGISSKNPRSEERGFFFCETKKSELERSDFLFYNGFIELALHNCQRAGVDEDRTHIKEVAVHHTGCQQRRKGQGYK